jgi:hypothetical protein
MGNKLKQNAIDSDLISITKDGVVKMDVFHLYEGYCIGG